ncbi:6-phosphogluconolactonase [Tropicimonas sp. S265A]|uniref:6-phosphogluconolactonase n=1 Tax=Tropicimonas sp. S265A TaxID=3415134 RepID=UPI003C7C192A
MDLREYPDREMLFIQLADRIAGELKETLLTHDRASLCVPGGTTPGPVFDILSDVDLSWDRIDVLLNDERWVPETSERSNTALLRRRLLTGRARAAHLVPLYADAPTPEDALDDLSTGVEAALPLSVLLLGMGTDMHTASLFPGADQLAEALSPSAPVLLAMRAPGAPEPRVTLTARVLRAALKAHLLIVGDTKRDALEKARRISPTEAPVAAVLGDAVVHWAP